MLSRDKIVADHFNIVGLRTAGVSYGRSMACNVSWSVSVYSDRWRYEDGESLMFIGPYIIAIVDELRTKFMSLAILFHLLCAQHVSDINISIFRSLRLCWWITTSVVLFSVRCVLELLVRAVFGGVRFAGWSTMAHGRDSGHPSNKS